MLVTEKQGNMRVVSPDGTVSEPLAGVPKVHYQGQVGLLDLALDKNFAQNRRIFFTYSENVNNDMDSHIVLASATLGSDLKSITGSKIIFGSMPALSNQRYGANQGGRIAVDRDGNLFVIIGDRAPTPPSETCCSSLRKAKRFLVILFPVKQVMRQRFTRSVIAAPKDWQSTRPTANYGRPSMAHWAAMS